MSIHSDVSAGEADLIPEIEEDIGVSQVNICTPQGLDLSSDTETSQGGEDEGEVKTEGNYEFDSRSRLYTPESAVMIFQGHKEQAVSSVSDRGDVVSCVPLVIDKPMEMSTEQGQNTQEQPSPQQRSIQRPTTRAEAEAGTGKTSKLGKKSINAKQVSAAPLHRKGPKGTRTCKKKKGVKGKKTAQDDAQQPASNPDSSEEDDSKMQVITVTIRFKNGDEITSGNLTQPGYKTQKRHGQTRDNFHHMTALQTSASRVPALGMGKPEGSRSNKKPALFKSKEGSKPSCPKAAIGDLLKGNFKKKAAQEKKPQRSALKGTVRKIIPSWEQRPKTTSVVPGPFPPITGVLTSGSSKRHSALPMGKNHSPHSAPRNRSLAMSAKECQLVAAGDKGLEAIKNYSMVTASKPQSPRFQEIPQAQFPILRVEQPCGYMHRAEFSSGDHNPRALQVPTNSKPPGLSQRGIRPRASVPSGDQEPPLLPPLPPREKQQKAPKLSSCTQCPLLAEEVDKLKEELAVIRALTEKFQVL